MLILQEKGPDGAFPEEGSRSYSCLSWTHIDLMPTSVTAKLLGLTLRMNWTQSSVEPRCDTSMSLSVGIGPYPFSMERLKQPYPIYRDPNWVRSPCLWL